MESCAHRPLQEHQANKRRQAQPSATVKSAAVSAEASDNNVKLDISNIDPRAVDSMLANQLQNLSVQDREAVNEVSLQIIECASRSNAGSKALMNEALSHSRKCFCNATGNSWCAGVGAGRISRKD